MPFGGILGAEPEKQVIQEIWIFAQVSLCLPKHTLLPFSKKKLHSFAIQLGFSGKPQEVALAHFKEVPGW